MLLFFPLLFFSATLIQNANTARILAVIPTASYSHQMFYQQIWRQLALRGHDMVIVTTDPTNETLPNFREVSIRESYKPFKALVDQIMGKTMFEMYLDSELIELSENLMKFQMTLPQIQELVKNESEHFDLLMLEHMPGSFYALTKRFKCPSIGIVSLDAFPVSHEVMGNAVHGILYPNPFLPYQGDITFWQRTVIFLMRVIEICFESMDERQQSDKVKEYWGFDADIGKAMEETDMLFVNANPLFSMVRPHSPSTINLAGGVHMKPPKELPKDIKDFLDGAKDGAIYFSFGSNVKSSELSGEMREVILGTLSQLPYKVLWKFEDDTLAGKPDNVKITKWAPQQDVLRHPNVKLFITQGGVQSLEESLYTHNPMVVIPFLGDQEGNAGKVQSKGLGLTIHPSVLTVETFKSAVLEVLENPKYRDNVKQLAGRIQDEPMTPLEKAVWWTEYVLRHKGAQHLKGPRIPVWQFYYLDVLVFLGGVFLVLFIIVALLIKLLIKGVGKLCAKSQKQTKQPKKLKKS